MGQLGYMLTAAKRVWLDRRKDFTNVCVVKWVGIPILGLSPSSGLLCDSRQIPIPLWISPFQGEGSYYVKTF